MNRDTKPEIYIRPVREILELLSTTTDDGWRGGVRVRADRQRLLQEGPAEGDRPRH